MATQQNQILEVHCKRCKVADRCPSKGASPLATENNRTLVLCRIVGGYGQVPVRDAILSEESRILRDKNGPCLTIAEIPKRDEASGHVYFDVTKIFHQPILHPRQATTEIMDRVYPRSHVVGKPGR